MNIDDKLLADAIAEKLVGDPEARAEWIRAQGGGRYLRVSEVCKKLGKDSKGVLALKLPVYELPGERGRRWYEPEVDAYMQTRRVGV